MKSFCFFFIFIFKASISQSPLYQNYWVIWNVGQGQWITHVSNDVCKHFDFGGEIYFFKHLQSKFIKSCSQKQNQLYLSHPDLDHYAFLSLIINRSSTVCWMIRPQRFKNSLSLQIPPCKDSFVELKIKNQTIITECAGRDKNACSTIFRRGNLLITGDSPKSQEKQWLPLLKNKPAIKILILGHHGSRTSTRQDLITQLPHLKMAVASARKKKYGHPHEQTERLLKAEKIPLLRTESWGNLIFY